MAARKTRNATVAAPAQVVITEAELTKFYLDTQEYRETQKKLAKLKTAWEKMDKSLVKRLEEGAIVDSSVYNVAIDKSQTKTNIAWKEVAIGLWNEQKLDGEAKAKELLEKTAPDVYPHAVVQLKVPVI